MRSTTAPAASVDRYGLRVDAARLLHALDELARFGADDRGGVSRLGFSPADNAARRHLVCTATAAGLAARIDEAGNVLVRRRGASTARPVLLMGSHLDSVPYGGRLDGAYGVVAALEVLTRLAECRVPLDLEPVAVAWANEEGSLFPCLFFGSRALTGKLKLSESFVDRSGQALRESLRAAGGDLDRIAAAAWPPDTIGGYLELHIEQGPVLERSNVPIGVVEMIVGRTVFALRVRGRAGHAGTTPMNLRSDALVAAAQLVLAVEHLAGQSGQCAVATVGSIEIRPNVGNVIPETAILSAEIRDGRPERLAAGERSLLAAAEEVAAATGTRVDVEIVERTQPVPTDASIRRAIMSAANQLELPSTVLASGAGHDAQIVAAVASTGMIFVPSRNGVSHLPEEDTDDDNLVAGANVLLHAALGLSMRNGSRTRDGRASERY